MIQGILVDASALTYIGEHFLPESTYVSGHLLTVGIAHLILSVCFGEALVFAHFYHGEVNAKLGCYILYELWL